MTTAAPDDDPVLTPRDGSGTPPPGSGGRPTLRLYDGYDHTSPNLRDAVEELQRLLVGHGLQIDVDGFFGRGTEAVVRQFQVEHELNDDGVVGSLTWAQLLDEPAVLTTTFPHDHPGLLRQLEQAQRYRSDIATAVDQFGVGVHPWLAPCIVAGIGSRESGWGLQLRPVGPTGTGDFAKRRYPAKYRQGPLPPDGGGFGRGLLQIDYDAHPFARSNQWKDASANISYGAKVLVSMYEFVKARASIRGIALLRAGLSGYNCGGGNVLRAINAHLDLDYYTTGRDYSVDVLNRAGWFQAHGWGGPTI